MKPLSASGAFLEYQVGILGQEFLEYAQKLIIRLANPEPLDEPAIADMRRMAQALQNQLGLINTDTLQSTWRDTVIATAKELLRLITCTEDWNNPEVRDEIALGLIGVAQACEIREEATQINEQIDVNELLTWILGHLQISSKRLATWLGVGESTLGRWRRGGVVPSPYRLAQLQTLVRLVKQLESVYLPPGTVRLLERPVVAWGGLRTVDVLDDQERIVETELFIASLRD